MTFVIGHLTITFVKTKVLVFGAFDGLHPGHIDFFKQAKQLGDYLVVSVGTDRNVEKIKGKKTLFNQNERLDLIRQLRGVDEAVMGAESNFYEAICAINPDVICLGYDQWAREDEVMEGLKLAGLEGVKIVRLKPYKQSRAKSAILKKKSVDF